MPALARPDPAPAHPVGCLAVSDLLPEYLHGRLPVSGVPGLRAHLDACPSCAAEARLLRALQHAWPAPPSADWSRVVRALPPPPQRLWVWPLSSRRGRRRLVHAPAWSARVTPRLGRGVTATAVALCVLLLATGDDRAVSGRSPTPSRLPVRPTASWPEAGPGAPELAIAQVLLDRSPDDDTLLAELAELPLAPPAGLEDSASGL